VVPASVAGPGSELEARPVPNAATLDSAARVGPGLPVGERTLT